MARSKGHLPFKSLKRSKFKFPINQEAMKDSNVLRNDLNKED